MYRILALPLITLVFAFASEEAQAYRDAVIVERSCDTRRIDGSPQMQRALRAVRAKNRGQKPVLQSCYRSQYTQETILRRHRCAPRYGSRNCAGVVASRSFHTHGVAVDMRLAARGEQVCHVLDEVRNEVLGGAGGVGAYGSDLGHLELRPSGHRTAWNVCGRIRGMRGQGIYSRPPRVSDYMRGRERHMAIGAWDSSVFNNPNHPNYQFMREFLGRGGQR
jgi:hypothetical protein